jgi:hypothetical protein
MLTFPNNVHIPVSIGEKKDEKVKMKGFLKDRQEEFMAMLNLHFFKYHYAALIMIILFYYSLKTNTTTITMIKYVKTFFVYTHWEMVGGQITMTH